MPTTDELIREGLYDEARARMLAGESGDADGLGVLLELRDWLRAKEYDKARKLLDQEGDLMAAYLEAQAVREALDAFESEDEARISPYSSDPHLGAEAWSSLALLRVRAKDLAGARQAFEEVMRRDAGHFRARTNLANLTFESGQTDEAIRMYEEVLKLHPDYGLAHHNLGAAYRKKGQLDKSVYHVKRGQRLQMRPAARPTRPGSTASSPMSERRPVWGGLAGRWWVWVILIVVAYFLLNRQP